LNGNSLSAIRQLGAARALFENLGKPLRIATTGVGTLVGTFLGFQGLDAASRFFSEHFSTFLGFLDVSIFSRPQNFMEKGTRFLADFATLVRASSSTGKRIFVNSQQFFAYLSDQFSFLEEKAGDIPVFASVFDIHSESMQWRQIHKPSDLRAPLAIVPYIEPCTQGKKVFVSTQSFQGVCPRFPEEKEISLHLCLDSTSEKDFLGSASSFEILLSCDKMRTQELKRRALSGFDRVINLWEPSSSEDARFISLFQQGFVQASVQVHKWKKQNLFL